MKRLSPGLFIGRLDDSNYPLWGLLFAIVMFGVPVIGIRFHLTKDGGDLGPVLFGFFIALEWGGG